MTAGNWNIHGVSAAMRRRINHLYVFPSAYTPATSCQAPTFLEKKKKNNLMSQSDSTQGLFLPVSVPFITSSPRREGPTETGAVIEAATLSFLS